MGIKCCTTLFSGVVLFSVHVFIDFWEDLAHTQNSSKVYTNANLIGKLTQYLSQYKSLFFDLFQAARKVKMPLNNNIVCHYITINYNRVFSRSSMLSSQELLGFFFSLKIECCSYTLVDIYLCRTSYYSLQQIL